MANGQADKAQDGRSEDLCYKSIRSYALQIVGRKRKDRTLRLQFNEIRRPPMLEIDTMIRVRLPSFILETWRDKSDNDRFAIYDEGRKITIEITEEEYEALFPLFIEGVDE